MLTSKREVLKRELEHLTVLLEIRSNEDEDRLAVTLLAILAQYYRDGDEDIFKDSFLAALGNAYRGLYPDEDFSNLIEKELDAQEKYLNGFTADLKNDRVSERQARARARMYALSLGSYGERVNLARQGERILKWHYDSSIEFERHCQDCKNLDGVSHPASWWLEKNLFPKSVEQLQCGTNCRCELR